MTCVGPRVSNFSAVDTVSIGTLCSVRADNTHVIECVEIKCLIELLLPPPPCALQEAELGLMSLASRFVLNLHVHLQQLVIARKATYSYA